MKTKLTIAISCIYLSLTAQTPIGSPPTPLVANNPNQAVTHANFAWYRGGNFNVGPAGNNNIFGTLWNSAIFHQTAGITRMQMNGTVSNVINNGASLPKDGFIGIGNPAGFYNGNGGGQGPFSLLHLNGNNFLGTPQTGGYRNWMQYGITSTHNQDLMFIGQRSTGGNDVTDAVIGWADNAASGFPGPDNMVFNFLAGVQGGSDDLSGTANFGREIMRLTGTGQVGIGPRFNNANQPKSTFHQHQENSAASWMQITNQASPIPNNPTTNVTGPTAITANDGLRWGIDGSNIGYIYNQENKHLLFSTNHNAGTSEERIRITHIGAPGTPNPSNAFPNDRTRVSISHNPATPVTRPLSLLHLGYNTQGATGDGWRPWMDVGMYVSQSSDNVFLGLKNESLSPFGDQLDAVLSWGDNQVNSGLPPFNGPDNFRFIFTSTQAASSPGSTQAKSANGLEALRMNPTLANGVYTGIGGDPTGNLYSAASPNPNNTLEVNSWGQTSTQGGSSGLRFTNLNITSPVLATNPGPGVLAVDANGDVVYVPAGNVGTNIGNYCSAPTQNPLTDDYEIPLNQQNYYFSGNNINKERVAVGVACGNNLPSKFNVLLDKTYNSSYVIGNNAGYFRNINSGSAHNVGVKGEVTAGPGDNSAGYFLATSNAVNAGNTGVTATAQNAGVANTGGSFTALGGVDAVGIFASASGASGTNYAANFNGDVYISGSFVGPSDQNLKENIDTITNALGIIAQLKPKSFDFKHTAYPSMNLPNGKQFGLIAQEVELILPELVTNNAHPAQKDSLGNIVTPAVNFKGLEYQQLIPFLIKGMQQQQAQIKKQDSLITALSNQINSCCSNTSARNNSNINQVDIELSDKDAIVLNQNVPNPFAEQTTITYNVPESVSKAQIIFYNNVGQIIQTVDVKTRGKGKVNVFASDLSSGLYHYTLIADGKVVDSKKMVRE
jgi:hypothetical protein